jgi:hypothetical protein
MSELYRQSKLTEEEMDYYVFPHVMAMTSEELHYKAQIAKELGARDKKIKELESELVKSTAWGVYHFTSEELAIRDLEQQAKGLADYAHEELSGLSGDNIHWMLSRAKGLRKQAKGGDV